MALSEKLTGILRSNTNLSELDLNNLTERQGWDIVYSLKPKAEPKTEICFTGFSPKVKSELTKIAEENNFRIAKSITVNLNFLCCGQNAGPAKIKKAKEKNVILLNAEEFRNLIKTGEIPR
ncbi:BRCA1 C Terminus (BRCT) domain-containing protein [Flavobacterium succinicans]|uniref:BRCA1 C Terminus (BRCT) domain-containing protein n=1 Tax=Flavobacterium succinicans TaxID=29536 RepID=A0A1I4XZT2_9FLAO|nr:BRCT domain-containing protein [Flavobacterium succinicans]SFN31307.1 BRCA1 C Terminus (BRCT) domain-containing protein [Flavobacterium succinicans]